MDGCLTRWIAAAALGLLPINGFAERLNNEWFSTTRNLSMGNAGIASSSDPTSAMFYNPAALSRAKRVSFEAFNPQLDIGTNVFSLSEGTSLPDNLSLEKIQPALRGSNYKASSLGLSLYPNFYTPSFNFGILLKAEGISYFDGTNTVYRSRYLVMPTAAFTTAIFHGRLRFGLALRAISLTENDQQSSATSGLGYRMNAAEGFGFAADAGALIALPWAGLPTIGFVARNLGDTRFSKTAPVGFATGTATRRANIPMSFDGGVSLVPKVGKATTLTVAADYRDLLNGSGTATLRHVNLGAELEFSKTFSLRGGVSQGYWTAGFGLSSKLGSLDIGTYADELNPSGFRKNPDRRISFRYGSKF
ncbi:MAG: hypothetical protein EOP11_06970 [Proteobacteria bacterium]|nr:MAG: hypothetical protein EOP11_06970 [Pseudomonadota bacterium]